MTHRAAINQHTLSISFFVWEMAKFSKHIGKSLWCPNFKYWIPDPCNKWPGSLFVLWSPNSNFEFRIFGWGYGLDLTCKFMNSTSISGPSSSNLKDTSWMLTCRRMTWRHSCSPPRQAAEATAPCSLAAAGAPDRATSALAPPLYRRPPHPTAGAAAGDTPPPSPPCRGSTTQRGESF